MSEKIFILNNLDEMHTFAHEFAKTLKAPVTIALHGDLGMGKSEIAREVIKTLRGKDTVVPSPTFTLDNDITLIEWPDIAKDMLPKNTIHIYITQNGDGRKLVVQ